MLFLLFFLFWFHILFAPFEPTGSLHASAQAIGSEVTEDAVVRLDHLAETGFQIVGYASFNKGGGGEGLEGIVRELQQGVRASRGHHEPGSAACAKNKALFCPHVVECKTVSSGCLYGRSLRRRGVFHKTALGIAHGTGYDGPVRISVYKGYEYLDAWRKREGEAVPLAHMGLHASDPAGGLAWSVFGNVLRKDHLVAAPCIDLGHCRIRGRIDKGREHARDLLALGFALGTKLHVRGQAGKGISVVETIRVVYGNANGLGEPGLLAPFVAYLCQKIFPVEGRVVVSFQTEAESRAQVRVGTCALKDAALAAQALCPKVCQTIAFLCARETLAIIVDVAHAVFGHNAFADYGPVGIEPVVLAQDDPFGQRHAGQGKRGNDLFPVRVFKARSRRIAQGIYSLHIHVRKPRIRDDKTLAVVRLFEKVVEAVPLHFPCHVVVERLVVLHGKILLKILLGQTEFVLRAAAFQLSQALFKDFAYIFVDKEVVLYGFGRIPQPGMQGNLVECPVVVARGLCNAANVAAENSVPARVSLFDDKSGP